MISHLTSRLQKLQDRQRVSTAKATIAVPIIQEVNPVVVNNVFDLRSSNMVNQPTYKTMSISFIASQIKNLSADVRLVAQKIIEIQKFHTLPQLVSREEIDRKVLDDNELLLFVGVRDLPKKKYHAAISASDRVKSIKTGNDYLVNGILGPALYTVQAVRDPKAKDNDEAAIMHAYNQALEYSKTDNKKGVVLRMTLKNDARIITYQDFLKLLAINSAQIKAELRNDEEYNYFVNVFLNTPTLVAIAQGYDAITMIPDGTVVILNRGALRIQKTNATTRNSMYAQVMAVVEEQEAIEREKKAKEEEKKKIQLRKEQEQEKKLQMEERKQALAEKKQQQSQVVVSDNTPQKTKSLSVFTFDDDVHRVLLDREDITDAEKMEIISFIHQYKSADYETQQVISRQLKEMIL
jgi:hypothetical protein